MMPWLTAAVYDRVMKKAEDHGLRAWRRDLVGSVSGRVLEVGAGTGANLPFYPDAAVWIILAEPDPRMRARLARRVREAGVGEPRVVVSDADVERLPFEDGSFDAVVVTLVLCSVGDPARALEEIRRVLVPGGALVYLEHVAADHDAVRLAWQRRIEPAWKIIAGNCHLTRRTSSSLVAAGFEVEHEARESARKTLPIVRTMIRGVARKRG
jgi:ubiquinone/menaquinone biosynthesis C-methylase UbiE